MANCLVLVQSPSSFFFPFVLLSAALVSYQVSMVATAQNALPAQARVAVDLIKNAQAQAIIGPPTSAEAEFVARIGDHARVPVISYSATSPTLTPVQTPFFVRTAANDSFQTAPVAAVLGAFSWRAAVVVYEDTPYGTGILPALSDALQGVGTKIMDRTAVPSDADDARLDAVLYHFMAMPTRVFVVHMLYPLAARLFRRAKKAGMMSQEYVWVATDGVGSFMDRLSPEDVDAMQGVVSLQPYVQLTDAAKNFSARLMARSRRENPADGGVADSTLMRLWSYDTAWAIAAAVETARVPSPAFQTPGGTTALTDLDRLGVSATGTALLKAVLATTFEGIAGKFKMVDGQLQLPAYEVVNIIGRGARTVGFWTPEFGITQDRSEPQQRQGAETWSAPKGWTVSPNGRMLLVAVPAKNGFKQFVDVSQNSTTGEEKITGYCIDVFDEVMKNLPYPVSYRYVPQNVSLDSYDKLVDLVRDQKFDLVVGDVTVTASRMAEVDFTMPFTESGWSMVVAAQEDTGSNMWVFVRPLSTGLWLASLGFFCFTGFVVWVIEHRINPEFRGTPCQQFGLIFYFAFSTLTFSHREKLQSNLSRFIVIMWVFVVLILTSSYTASLTSMLTVQKLLPTVTDVRELQRNGHYIGYQEGSFIESSLQKMGFDQSRMRKYNSSKGYADALSRGSAKGGVAAVFDEIPYLKLFLSEYCKDYMMVGPIYKTVGLSFVFPKDSPMTGDVSRGILTLAEGEKMSKIEKAWFGEPDACLQQSSAEVAPSSGLRFKSFGGIFLLTGLASGLTLLVYLATFAIRERSGLRAAEATAGSGSGSVPLWKLRAWLQHYDTRDLRSPTFRTRHDEFNACDCANRTPTWNDESVRNGGTSPFSVRVNSEMNAASSLENTPASEAGNSLEQGVEGATTSAEMATSTVPQLHR
ncbi:glutamate receptor 2.7 [Triticum aestivum]|uniref:glutamate receptor 2.7 n=1 Tax=Triticum aestivum TaxID=4565 RepID=UPI001D02DBF9|nr:glutamate receptor 2.7-like [Triticum aestivum]